MAYKATALQKAIKSNKGLSKRLETKPAPPKTNHINKKEIPNKTSITPTPKALWIVKLALTYFMSGP